MNWITKLVSFFLGEDDKEYEKKHMNLQEELNARNVFSNPSMVEGQNQPNNKAEAKARVAYQYPKGNFRFPIIPDEQSTNFRQRPNRTIRTYEKERNHEEVVSTSNSTTNKPREIVKKSEGETTKRPFSPTIIPSPVYGFQPRDESLLIRSQLGVEKQASSSSVFSISEDQESSNTILKDYQQEPVTSDLYFDNNRNTYEEKDLKNEMNFSHGNIEKTQLSSKKNIEGKLEDDDRQMIDDSSSLNTSYEEIYEADDQTEELLFENELELEGSQVEEELSLSNTDQELANEVMGNFNRHNYKKNGLYREPVNSNESDQQQVATEQKKHVIEAEEELYTFAEVNELENSLEHESVICQIENQLIEEKPQSVTHHQVEHSRQGSQQPVTHHQEVRLGGEKRLIKENTKTNKGALPFNVMMLGRDKQRMKAQENSYQFPSLAYLNIPEKEFFEDDSWLNSQRELLDVTLKNFNVGASVVNVTQGPSVTRFEVHPEPGVKVNKITNLSDDIKLSLAAKDIRIEAPIPGKNTIGIEVPNKVSKMVYLRDILRSPVFRTNPSPMTAVLGLDISGQPVVTDLKKMPHGLIAGATGSGKSVCINTILVSLLYKASPHEVKLMLIDPKMVELAPYNAVPHLVSPVITDVKAATAALKWAVEEMERRYELFAHSGTREITRYNQLVKEHKQGEHLPYLVIVIDELADLMMIAPSDVEEAICRLAQKARACGIHLIVATQRPSVDVITGLIKANIPTRIAFSVSSQVDSRTIIDVNGAEKLLGKGDMLFLENGSSKAVRLQGTFVSDEEIERVVKHVKHQSKPNYLFHQDELVKKATIQSEEDELFLEACEFVVNQGGASTSLLQRRFRIGYNRAARLIDMMEEQGIISENRGSKPRDILISEEELELIQGE